MGRRFWICSTVALVLVILIGCVQPAATPPPAKAPAAPPTAAPKAKATTPAAGPAITAAPSPKPKPKGTAPSGPPFYQGKTIEITVGSTAGGGTDTAARIIAAVLPKHIPGNPRIIVRNVPGTQGAVNANVFFEKGKPDGLNLMENSSGSLSLQLKKDPIVRYDLAKFKHIGNIARAGSVLFVRKGLKDRITDRSGPPLVVATAAGSESWQAMPIWAREFLGWNVRWVTGFLATSEMELAFRRGEIDMLATANSFIIRRLVEEGLAETVTTEGAFREGKFTRRPDFPDVPSFDEVLGDKKPSGLPWQAYLAWVGPGLVDKFLSAPQDTPDNLVSILVESYERMAQDPQFISLVKKTVTDVYDISTGKEINDMMRTVMSAPPEAVQYGKDLQVKFGILPK
ncbi:MAG: hypothetical protein HYY29_00285 [Chloroflexi bacterium]|nr:hypothetical protein [Chloroflexota bacterium]